MSDENEFYKVTAEHS